MFRSITPSLAHFYKELHDDCGCYIPNNGYLEKWAREGVMLLNTVLTCLLYTSYSIIEDDYSSLGYTTTNKSNIGTLTADGTTITVTNHKDCLLYTSAAEERGYRTEERDGETAEEPWRYQRDA